MSDFKLIDLPEYKDKRGCLTAMEGVLPFDVVRLYWIFNADGNVRGGHRHTYTRQGLIAISGEVLIHIDDGIKKEDIALNNPSQCLIVEPEDWHTMTFSRDAVLLVLASHNYDRSEYIDTPYEDISND